MLYSYMSGLIISIPELINEVMWFHDLTFSSLSKVNGLTMLFDHSNETSFAVLLFACATDGIKHLIIHSCAKHHQNTWFGYPPVYQDLSTHHDWPVKKSHCWFAKWIRLKRNLKRISGNSISPLGPRTTISALLPRHIYVYDTGYTFVLVYLLCCPR